MKTPDPSSEAFRAGARTEIALAEPGPRRSEEREEADFEPKYLSIPQRRPRGQGRRNLIVGVILLVLSGLLFGWALILAGPGAVYTVACTLATAATLYVVARARLLRQRNGAFLAGAIVCLLGVFLVLVQQAWVVATHAAVKSEIAVASVPATVEASAGTPPPLPALLETFKPTAAEMESGAMAKVLRGVNVEVNRKLYRLRAGDLLPVAGVGRDEVRLAAGAQEVAVPASVVDVIDPAEAAPARTAGTEPAHPPEASGKASDEVTRRSQVEATKKYPALARVGSPENQAFVEAYREMKFAGNPGFFDNPEWPMRLATQLAAREGWDQPKGANKPAPAEDESRAVMDSSDENATDPPSRRPAVDDSSDSKEGALPRK